MAEFPPVQETVRYDGTNVTAVLGPTNTGKTFLAIERMVAHSSGTIGLPLRLLAREVYQKVCDRVGPAAVSLITGEEKIKPPNARYAVCTVEAMPRAPNTAFVAIDEVQLAGDLERGHVFTDRILHARGREETLLLGASTMQGVLQRLLKGVQTVTRPRLSNLVYAGSKKITRLPRRTAIVAFSADEVYAIAELIRRQRGGAAVVLGALSPRTRNAQVALYQSGDVDFLVATDAIGMGLNLDVDHVAFAQDWKFDGFQYRQLTAAEFGQIAGRAGRHLRDGTFGVTGRVDPLPGELAEALEAHVFQPVRVLQWRSRDFDFASIAALKDSLERPPPCPELTKSLPSVDQRALEYLSRDANVADLARGRERVELLWEACKLPDYRRIAPAQHAEIIAAIYVDLAVRGHVAEDYMASQVNRADRTDGDIDTLSQRIAEIRTWTYISHRPEWLADPTHWQEKTRAIEDRLSDALHDRLTKRFVDRRTSVLMKRLRENAFMEAEISGDGTVVVEGHTVGELQGFRFTLDGKAEGQDGKAVRAASQKALAGEFEKRAERFANAPNGDIALGSDGLIRWLGAPVASLAASDDPLKPKVVLFADEQLSGPERDKVAARAERSVTYQVSTVLKPLVDLKSAEGLEGTAKGLAFRLSENLGMVQRRDVAEEVRSLDQDARAALRRCGVRFGAYHIFIPALIKPAPAALLTLLWAVNKDGRERPGYGEVTHLLATGRTSAVADPAIDPVFFGLAGYRLLGRRAVRVDILERLADLIRPALAWKPGTGKRPEGGYNGAQFLVTPAMMSILGATAEDMEEVLKGLGYRPDGIEAGTVEAEIQRLDAETKAAEVASRAEAERKAAEAVATLETPQPQDESGDAPATSEAAGEPAEEQPSAESSDGSTADAVVPVAAVASEEGAEGEPTASAADPVAAAGDTPAATSPVESPVAETAPDETVVGEPASESDGEPAAPKLVQVWRPQRAGGRAGHRQGQRGKGRETGGGATAPERGQRIGKGDQKSDGGTENERQAKGRPNRDWKERGERKEGGGGRRFDKPQTSYNKPVQARPQRVDPDSPFAKLAALKDKLGK
ncbi:helicase-related protein [Aurantimonas sp. C2-6-R+9]|uniref:helicase-related protein n=1 Tax=unclassified Aurantimonas TaxID=2638230 RepID=UPI002E183A71|nr:MULTISPECIES: helicase-related protein [unclassified Aurantimonas]MEC5290370.1 helicase-related protein [Aurantimonas sp. C2-3-R2]MEC5379798.1 helicase-related protein [Aurantimonas sp. C2-6-R+9]MEC5411374.1 helicase-related protein [Aurantimonas sp. C2-4-R8]